MGGGFREVPPARAAPPPPGRGVKERAGGRRLGEKGRGGPAEKPTFERGLRECVSLRDEAVEKPPLEFPLRLAELEGGRLGVAAGKKLARGQPIGSLVVRGHLQQRRRGQEAAAQHGAGGVRGEGGGVVVRVAAL